MFQVDLLHSISLLAPTYFSQAHGPAYVGGRFHYVPGQSFWWGYKSLPPAAVFLRPHATIQSNSSWPNWSLANLALARSMLMGSWITVLLCASCSLWVWAKADALVMWHIYMQLDATRVLELQNCSHMQSRALLCSSLLHVWQVQTRVKTMDKPDPVPALFPSEISLPPAKHARKPLTM